ncbi:endonuclease/exonuclease/phosphatase family protein [Bifidobacterium phasiani]|uniref:Endonuclease/exonuclease/phosphatase family protein n=1 Tax=Bifidobacterium phasiani TaxID=2834431 RepID=A0ABS6W909_9BIFI|nr:endonuclease/exonuclease/phosphatase family protein [Bifidobacterium phasiani]MBW3082993.1 endonuclease/exonuclease/phosphatase family protein [Bifidobacterium phasiani]
MASAQANGARRSSTRRTNRTGAWRTLLRVLAGVFALVALVGVAARALPAGLQALPYVPVVVSATPWFVIPAVLSLACALASRRWIVALLAVACIGLQVWWQYPFFVARRQLPDAALAAMAEPAADITDRYARVMTLNVYRGDADPARIVETVRGERVEVLALQETTDAFVQALNEAGIGDYLPYAQVSSSDGVFGNGIWSASPLIDPSADDVNAVSSFMPGGTVMLGDAAVRFVSVHTTAPVPGYWDMWKRSLDDLALMRADTDTRYVFMGDFNATVDHAPFRDFLGDRFADAVMQSGQGLAFTWPADRPWVPRFAGIDHVVVDRGIATGRCEVVDIDGSDHAALLTTIAVS